MNSVYGNTGDSREISFTDADAKSYRFKINSKSYKFPNRRPTIGFPNSRLEIAHGPDILSGSADQSK